MLPGFLTTALELIIILDVCGAVIYFVLTGLSRIKKPSAQAAPAMINTSSAPSFGIDTPMLATAQPCAIPRPITPDIYLPKTPETGAQRQWMARFKNRVTMLRQAFTYRPATQGVEKTRAADTDYARLGRVLDSFKEEA